LYWSKVPEKVRRTAVEKSVRPRDGDGVDEGRKKRKRRRKGAS